MTTWYGIDASRFYQYRNWTNTKGNLCGSYAAAVLIAYYQDYRTEITLPAYLRQPFADGENLVAYLRLFIQPLGYSTIACQVSLGISRFCQYHQQKIWARSTPIGGITRAIKRIDQHKPVIVGLNRFLGSTYGNHWVVAYAYRIDENGAYIFRIHDNWGAYQKEVPANWILGTVSFP